MTEKQSWAHAAHGTLVLSFGVEKAGTCPAYGTPFKLLHENISCKGDPLNTSTTCGGPVMW